MADFIISLDMGTTSTKGILYDTERGVAASASQGYPSLFPSPGIVEQDQDTVLRAVVRTVRTLMERSGVSPFSVRGLVFGGILHSLLPLGHDGAPLSPAMLWSDLRASPQSDALRRTLDAFAVRSRTGCSIHPLYYPARLLWLKEKREDLFEKTARFISIKEYVLHRLYGSDLVDYSIASGTGLLNMVTLDWDEQMLEITGLSPSRLSTPVETTTNLTGLRRKWASDMGLAAGTPAVIGGSDGPLAHLGSVGLAPDSLSLTVGTSAALRRTGREPSTASDTESWCYYMTEGMWVVGGVVHDAGNLVDWFARFLAGEGDPVLDIDQAIAEALERVPAGAEGLLFLPFFSGERSPRYNPDARGALLGLTFAHSRHHVLRAMLEGISFRILTVYRMLDPGGTARLVVTGGVLKSPPRLSLLADFLGKNLLIPQDGHAAARGGVRVALRGLGALSHEDKLYTPPHTLLSCDPGRRASYEEVRRAYESGYGKLFT